MHFYIMPCVNLYKGIQTYMKCMYSYCILFFSLPAELPTASLDRVYLRQGGSVYRWRRLSRGPATPPRQWSGDRSEKQATLNMIQVNAFQLLDYSIRFGEEAHVVGIVEHLWLLFNTYHLISKHILFFQFNKNNRGLYFQK